MQASGRWWWKSRMTTHNLANRTDLRYKAVFSIFQCAINPKGDTVLLDLNVQAEVNNCSPWNLNKSRYTYHSWNYAYPQPSCKSDDSPDRRSTTQTKVLTRLTHGTNEIIPCPTSPLQSPYHSYHWYYLAPPRVYTGGREVNAFIPYKLHSPYPWKPQTTASNPNSSPTPRSSNTLSAPQHHHLIRNLHNRVSQLLIGKQSP